MTTIDYGAPVKAIWAGAPAGGTYAVALTRPDGTNFTPPTINTTPAVSVTFTPDMAGRWLIRWTSSTVIGAYTDIADVWPQDPKFIISLDDARTALQMAPNTPPETLDDLRLYIAAATPVIEDMVGPVSIRTTTQRVQKGWAFAALYDRPNSVTSVVLDDASTVPVGDYTVDLGPGIVTFNYALAQGATITYATGPALVPQNVRQATRELVKHWWQLGRNTRGGTAPPAEAWTPAGFAVPRRVIELCEPSKRKDTFG
jgi:hypothetical protein